MAVLSGAADDVRQHGADHPTRSRSCKPGQRLHTPSTESGEAITSVMRYSCRTYAALGARASSGLNQVAQTERAPIGPFLYRQMQYTDTSGSHPFRTALH